MLLVTDCEKLLQRAMFEASALSDVRREFVSACVPMISIVPADRSSSLTTESTAAHFGDRLPREGMTCSLFELGPAGCRPRSAEHHLTADASRSQQHKYAFRGVEIQRTGDFS